MIVDSDPNEKVISLKSLEAFTAAANGQATKIIIPSEIQGLARAGGFSERNCRRRQSLKNRNGNKRIKGDYERVYRKSYHLGETRPP